MIFLLAPFDNLMEPISSFFEFGVFITFGRHGLFDLHRRHGFPVWIFDDLACVFHAAAQRRNTRLERFVHDGEADELFAERGKVAYAKEHRVVVPVNLHVTREIPAVTHDVVAVGIARRVELTFAGDIPVAHDAGALQHHIRHDGGREVLTCDVAVTCVVSVDKESGVGQTDLFDDAAREHAALEAKLVHLTIAGGAQIPFGDGVGNAERQDKLVLPKERSAVEVQARGLDHIEPVGPFGESLDALRNDEHIVIHDPKPLSTQLVCPLGTGGETACPSAVLGLGIVDNACRAALRIGVSIVSAPKRREALVELRAHLLRLVRVLVIDDHDAPRRNGELGDRVKQIAKQLLTLVRHDDDGEFLDGNGTVTSHEPEYPFAWAAFGPYGFDQCVFGKDLTIVTKGTVSI